MYNQTVAKELYKEQSITVAFQTSVSLLRQAAQQKNDLVFDLVKEMFTKYLN